MSAPIVLQEFERTEIEWVAGDDEESMGLAIVQSNSDGSNDDSVWIPSGHVDAFIAAIHRACKVR